MPAKHRSTTHRKPAPHPTPPPVAPETPPQPTPPVPPQETPAPTPPVVIPAPPTSSPAPSPAPDTPEPASSQVQQLAALDTQPDAHQPSPLPPVDTTTPKPHRIFWFVLAISLLAGVSVAGLAIYSLFSSRSGTKSPASPAPVVSTPSPSVSPTPAANRTGLKIHILNGSGTPGAAGIAKDFLESLGYQNVTTGNADSYDYSQTEMSIKSSRTAYLGSLTSDLTQKYTLSEQSAPLPDTSSYDVVIIIGRK